MTVLKDSSACLSFSLTAPPNQLDSRSPLSLRTDEDDGVTEFDVVLVKKNQSSLPTCHSTQQNLTVD